MSEPKKDSRKLFAAWLPFAFTVVTAFMTWMISGVSQTTTLKNQVVQTAAHQIEQDARMDKFEAAQSREKDDFVPRTELTRILTAQDLRTQRIEDKLDRVLENQSIRQATGR